MIYIKFLCTGSQIKVNFKSIRKFNDKEYNCIWKMIKIRKWKTHSLMPVMPSGMQGSNFNAVFLTWVFFQGWSNPLPGRPGDKFEEKSVKLDFQKV